MSDTAYAGQQNTQSAASAFNATTFLFSQLAGKIWTAMPVKVMAVTNTGSDVAAGTVDVQPLVNQIDGEGNATPHGTIYGIPYFRLQGGANAIIIDPQVGDIGDLICCQRDISSVIANKAQSTPGSLRRFDPADGFYFGGFLNGVPSQYVRFYASNIEIKAPTVTVTGNLNVTGSITATGDVIGNGTHLHTHVHSGVTTGSGNSGAPV